MSIRGLTTFATLLACAFALSACLTPHAQPKPSPAVLEARGRVGAKPAACAPGGLDAISPVQVGFPFDDAQMPDAGARRLAAAARWLSCNPGVEVAILPSADNHGDTAHQDDLAQRRAQATVATLRDLGATAAVLHITRRGGADPIATPHLVIEASGRGW
ncbi:MAG: hypothetical protein JSS35_16040 [Proteobacteria bacterium]|nr:hypothetical protein [Pseudomonadota bacterium]